VASEVFYHFRPALWVAGGLGFGIGQESTIDGDKKDDRRENLVFTLSAGYSITRNFGLKLGYLGTRALADTGIDSDSLIAAASFFWSEASLFSSRPR
jgi:hypothetical protein